MALVSQFSRELKKLFRRRTAWLHSAVGKKSPGRAPAFTKKRVKPALEKLAKIARESLINRRARPEFDAVTVAKRQWHLKNKGWGVRAKRDSFKRWYERNIQSHNCVYVLWSHRRCEYVGRTLRGKGRPSSSFEKYWFRSVTRIDIYSVRTPTVVAKAECLAIHIFEPRRNEISSSRPKFSKRCPICVADRDLKRELSAIFPLRRRKKRKHK